MIREFGVKFVYQGRGDEPMDQNRQYQLRRGIAEALEHCGFGQIHERPGGHFDNELVRPAVDTYDLLDDILFISYYWYWPMRGPGDVTALLTQEVVNLHEEAAHLNINFTFRSTIT